MIRVFECSSLCLHLLQKKVNKKERTTVGNLFAQISICISKFISLKLRKSTSCLSFMYRIEQMALEEYVDLIDILSK